MLPSFVSSLSNKEILISMRNSAGLAKQIGSNLSGEWEVIVFCAVLQLTHLLPPWTLLSTCPWTCSWSTRERWRTYSSPGTRSRTPTPADGGTPARPRTGLCSSLPVNRRPAVCCWGPCSAPSRTPGWIWPTVWLFPEALPRNSGRSPPAPGCRASWPRRLSSPRGRRSGSTRQSGLCGPRPWPRLWSTGTCQGGPWSWRTSPGGIAFPEWRLEAPPGEDKIVKMWPKNICDNKGVRSVSVRYPSEVHAQFELGEQVEDDAPLVVQDTQVLLFVILRIRHLITGADVFQPCGVLHKQEENTTCSAFESWWKGWSTR